MVYSKQTWTDNASPLTAARMTVIENGIASAEAAGLSTMPRAQLYQTTAQTGLVAGNNLVTLQAATIDTHGGLDSVSKGYKVPSGQGGVYLVDGGAMWNGVSAGNTAYLAIYVNGSAPTGAGIGGMAYAAGAGYVVGISAGSRLLTVNAGDTITLNLYTVVAGSATAIATGFSTWMSVVRIA